MRLVTGLGQIKLLHTPVWLFFGGCIAPIPVMRVEHRLCRDVASVCFGERWTVDLGQSLAPANVVAQGWPHLRHPPGHERRHRHLTIRVGLDDTRQTNLRP